MLGRTRQNRMDNLAYVIDMKCIGKAENIDLSNDGSTTSTSRMATPLM